VNAFLLGLFVGAAGTLALVVVGVYVRAEWTQHERDVELERAWQRERGER
jgi:predicted transporter